MVLFDLFSSTEEVDDIKSLPIQLREAYTNPYKILALDRETSDTKMVRETFRKTCMAHIPHFSGFSKQKYTVEQIILAYHLIRKTLTGPATKISRNLDNLPQLDFRAEDILPTLRPMTIVGNDVTCRKDYRAFRMLSVTSLSYRSEPPYAIAFYKILYRFDVHYMLRRHTVEREYSEFVKLNNHLEIECLTVPELPADSGGLRARDTVGEELADYLMRVHVMVANLGLFSARLMRFLDVDFEKVQSEEEGAVVALLDSQSRPNNTVWHIVNEDWLSRWRTFVMGRGPRRYFPPGPIDNEELIEELEKGNRDLQLSKDYRCLNFNVWRFYELVHGGGPSISRLDDDIYGRFSLSYLQAAIRIQTIGRIYLCRRLRRKLFMKRLSTSQVGKSVIFEAALEQVEEKAKKLMKSNQKERVAKNLEKASNFTQALWRIKKKYLVEENLEGKKRDQEVFRKAKNLAKDVPHSISEGAVISNMHPIINVGNVRVYQRRLFDAEGGIPFSLMKRPGTEEALIEKPKDSSVFEPHSKLLAINTFPTNVLTYEEIKQKLEVAQFPIELELENPLNDSKATTVTSIADIAAIQNLPSNELKPENKEILTYNTFKLVMQTGIYLIKHNSGGNKLALRNTRKNSSHLTQVRIDDKSLYYTSKFDPARTDDEQWNSFYLYKMNFILYGTESEAIKKRASYLNPKVCFEIIMDDRGLIFELPEVDQMHAMVEDFRQQKQEQVAKNNARLLEKNSFMTRSIQRAQTMPETNQITAEGRDELGDIARATDRRAAASAVHFFDPVEQASAAASHFDQRSLWLDSNNQSPLHNGVDDVDAAQMNNNNNMNSLMENFDTAAMALFSQLNMQQNEGSKAAHRHGEEDPTEARCKLIVNGLIKLVGEIRGSQTFIDRTGIPIRRVRPKVSLKKYDGPT